ncbi:hypothetical protein [Dongia mobilis]|uniref:hypothetical protein n=1 Tax=Dongia sp. TaxID=1977262 RepID=UPI0026EE55BE
MSVTTRLQVLGAVLAVLAIASAATPSAAKERYRPVPAPFGWQQVDRDGNGDVTKKEWKWAEKHGYDRLDRDDNLRVERKEYQALLNRYLAFRNQHQARYQRWDDADRFDDGGTQAWPGPWQGGRR